MNNHNLTLRHDLGDRNNFLTLKLALKTPKQDFSDSMFQKIANATTVSLNSVYKLPGIGTDKFDWYFVEISGTFDREGWAGDPPISNRGVEDLVLTIVCWRILLIEKHLTVLSR